MRSWKSWRAIPAKINEAYTRIRGAGKPFGQKVRLGDLGQSGNSWVLGPALEMKNFLAFLAVEGQCLDSAEQVALQDLVAGMPQAVQVSADIP